MSIYPDVALAWAPREHIVISVSGVWGYEMLSPTPSSQSSTSASIEGE